MVEDDEEYFLRQRLDDVKVELDDEGVVAPAHHCQDEENREPGDGLGHHQAGSSQQAGETWNEGWSLCKALLLF